MSASAPSTISSSASAASVKVALTVVIPTLNEGAQIASAVSDLAWVDEVIVVDGGSSDETRSLAESAGARVLEVCGETIAGQRNAGIAAARNQWEPEARTRGGQCPSLAPRAPIIITQFMNQLSCRTIAYYPLSSSDWDNMRGGQISRQNAD